MKLSITLLLFIKSVKSANILGILPFPCYSHVVLGHAILKELANKGHNVTVYSFYPLEVPIANHTVIQLDHLDLDFSDQVKQLYQSGQTSVVKQMNRTTHLALDVTSVVLRNRVIQELLKEDSRRFDLVFMETFMNDALMIIGHHFKCPFVLYTASPRNIYNNFLFGNPSPSSYVANNFAELSSKMSFWQRTKNLFYDIAGQAHYHLVIVPKHAQLLKKLYPSAPDLSEIHYKADLLLVNSHVSIHDAAPTVPSTIDIAGHHIGPTESLPKELQEFFQGANQGVVLVSFGSMLQVSMIPKEKLRVLVGVLSRIKYKVLWKTNVEVSGLPENIKVVKWMPQHDVLAQPQVKAFITHGGILSVTEAVYFGVPFVGLPFFWDQYYNVEQSASKGYAKKIPISQITEENLSEALEEILHNPKYKEKMKIYSRIMRDRPQKPLDTAMYHIEYLMRYGGAVHYKSPGMHLKWYQRYLLDVIGFFIVILIVLVVTFSWVVKVFCRLKRNFVGNQTDMVKKLQ